MAEKKTVTFTPSEPLDHDGQTYETLTFGKCKAKHLVAMDVVKGDNRKSFALFAAMADVPIQVIEELDMDDFARLGEEVAPLMGKSAQKAVAEAKAGEEGQMPPSGLLQ